MPLDEFRTLNEHSARTTARVIDRTRIRLNEHGHQLDDVSRRVEFALMQHGVKTNRKSTLQGNVVLLQISEGIVNNGKDFAGFGVVLDVTPKCNAWRLPSADLYGDDLIA